MKIWFVIFVAGKIGGTVGPVPYDMAECQSRADAENRKLQVALADGTDMAGRPISTATKEYALATKMQFGCMEAEQRPTNTYVGDTDGG